MLTTRKELTNLSGILFGNKGLVQVFSMQQDRWSTILDQKETHLSSIGN